MFAVLRMLLDGSARPGRPMRLPTPDLAISGEQGSPKTPQAPIRALPAPVALTGGTAGAWAKSADDADGADAKATFALANREGGY